MEQIVLFRQDATDWYYWRNRRLNRDRGRCMGCGGFASCVHHRRYVDALRWLASICRRCHARLHHRAVWSELLGYGRLFDLWREWHPGGPVQLALDFAA